MSRDAKVGLVIIVSFAFLLGTILVYRFHLTGGSGNSSFNEPVVSESDSDPPVNEFGTAFPVGDSGVSPVAVEAREPLASHSQGGTVQPRDAGFAEAQRLVRTPNLTRPPSDVSASQANGALISLTEGETNQRPAAIVESSVSAGRRPSGGRRTEAADSRDEIAGHARPPLEIHNPVPDVGRDHSNSSEMVAHEAGDDSQEIAGLDDLRGSAEAMEADVATDATDASDDRTAAADQHYGHAQQRRPHLSRSPRNELEMDEVESVQQVAGNRRPERELDTPPPLPRFGESRQATIESVSPRNVRSDQYTDPPMQSPNPSSRPSPVNRTTLGKSDSGEDRSFAAQRSYVVKEGDSFWSISAKQYGTGKYFRALEEFNGHRLAAYEDGRRILRPGTEILLPDPSAMRSKSAISKQAGTSSSPDEKGGFRPRQGLDSSQEGDARGFRPSRANVADDHMGAGDSKLYYVQEGDTLSMIAQRELGSSKRWQEIYELNREKLDNKQTIRIGMELKLPAD